MVEAPRPAPSPAVPDRASASPSINHDLSPHYQAAARTEAAGVSAPPTASGERTGYSFSSLQSTTETNDTVSPGDIPPTRPLPQDEDPDLKTPRPWENIPKAAVQRIIDGLEPGEQLEIMLDQEVINVVEEGPSGAQRPELTAYGVKENDTGKSLYLGLKNKSTDATPSNNTNDTQSPDKLPVSPKVTVTMTDAVVPKELVKEVRNQVGGSPQRVASVVGDIMGITAAHPNFDPGRYEVEYLFESGRVADVYEEGHVGEVRSTKVERVYEAAVKAKQYEKDAQDETGIPTTSEVELYDRNPKAWIQDKDKAA